MYDTIATSQQSHLLQQRHAHLHFRREHLRAHAVTDETKVSHIQLITVWQNLHMHPSFTAKS